MVHKWELWKRKTKPWKIIRKHNNYTKFLKKAKHRVERHKMKRDLEYYPSYNKYRGWEY